MKRIKVEILIIVCLLILAIGILSGSYEASKTNRFADLLAKFAFAILVAVVARLVSLAFSYADGRESRKAEAYLSLSRLGMKAVYYPLPDSKVSKRLATSSTIKVLKTWFPENFELEKGLEKALKKNNASIILLLCHPSYPLLFQRSLSATKSAEQGPEKVISALKLLHKWICETGRGEVKIGLYKVWPGCPVIWCDKKVIMGFYFTGKSSPHWPWVEVEPGSKLEEILDYQFDLLWNDPGTEKLETPEKLREWLENQSAELTAAAKQ